MQHDQSFLQHVRPSPLFGAASNHLLSYSHMAEQLTPSQQNPSHQQPPKQASLGQPNVLLKQSFCNPVSEPISAQSAWVASTPGRGSLTMGNASAESVSKTTDSLQSNNIAMQYMAAATAAAPSVAAPAAVAPSAEQSATSAQAGSALDTLAAVLADADKLRSVKLSEGLELIGGGCECILTGPAFELLVQHAEPAVLDLVLRSTTVCAHMRASQKMQLMQLLGSTGLTVSNTRHIEVRCKLCQCFDTPCSVHQDLKVCQVSCDHDNNSRPPAAVFVNTAEARTQLSPVLVSAYLAGNPRCFMIPPSLSHCRAKG